MILLVTRYFFLPKFDISVCKSWERLAVSEDLARHNHSLLPTLFYPQIS